MNDPRRRPTIESNLKLLSAVALGVFVALIAGLVLVQHTLVSSHRIIEAVVVPAQQDLVRLDSAVAGIFDVQARASSTASGDQLRGIADHADVWLELEGAQAQLERHLEMAGAGVRSRDAQARAANMSPAILAFLRADDELFASLARFHALREDFARRLAAAQSELRGVIEESAAIKGFVQLDYVLLLRHLASAPGDGRLVHEVVFGDARAQLQCVDDLANAALDLSALSGRIGLAPDADSLNSIAANEIAQNRQRVADGLDDLMTLTADQAELRDRSRALRARFLELTAAIGDEQRSDSLLAVRRAILLERQHAAEVAETGQRRARELMSEVAGLQAAADAVTADSSRHVGRTARATRFGVLLLAVVGIAASVLGARRVAASVRELRAQNEHLGKLRDELTRGNERLEQQVAERTNALAQRERSLQLVLDSTGDGLLSVALDGAVQAERSRAASEWFGPPAERPDAIWALLHPNDPRAALGLRMSFDQLVEEMLPFELTVEQMPRKLDRDGRVLELTWKAVAEDGALKRVLLIARDVTERIEAERTERRAQEMRDLVGSVLGDKAGFLEGIHDARTLLGVIATTGDPDVLRRAIHTLKGNAAMFGFHQLAARCHDLEGELSEADRRLREDQIGVLRAEFEATLHRIKEVLGEEFLSIVEVREQDLDWLMRALEQCDEPSAIRAFVASWRDESVDTVLRRFAAQARRIGANLGKEVDVVVEDAGARVPAGELRTFWNGLIHAVRNAVDHGIETPGERLAAGKPARGKLLLRAIPQEQGLVVQIEDDGRGLDLAALRVAAERKGLPCATREDLVEALFVDGVTTKSEVTDLSGRGVGMAALREACRDLGGTVEVESWAGAGTRFTFILPVSRPSGVGFPSVAA